MQVGHALCLRLGKYGGGYRSSPTLRVLPLSFFLVYLEGNLPILTNTRLRMIKFLTLKGCCFHLGHAIALTTWKNDIKQKKVSLSLAVGQYKNLRFQCISVYVLHKALSMARPAAEMILLTPRGGPTAPESVVSWLDALDTIWV